MVVIEEKLNSKAFAISILTAADAVRIAVVRTGIANALELTFLL